MNKMPPYLDKREKRFVDDIGTVGIIYYHNDESDKRKKYVLVTCFFPQYDSVQLTFKSDEILAKYAKEYAITREKLSIQFVSCIPDPRIIKEKGT